MPKRIVTEEHLETIRKLITEGLNAKEISQRFDLKYETIHNWIKAIKAGYKSPGEYFENLFKKRGFKSQWDYERQRITKATGLNSKYEYLEYLALARGFRSYHEYMTHIAESKGFSSYSEYLNSLKQQRKHRPKNRKLSNLLKSRLNELGKSQSWLARELYIPRNTINKYVMGYSVPSKERLEKILSVLGIEVKTLEEIVLC